LVLEQLVREGLLLQEGRYYLKSEWSSTGFSSEQLVMFRLLRDVCIDLAIQFKPLSRNLPNTILTLPWQDFYIYLYSPINKEAVINTLIDGVGKSNAISIIVVPDEEDVEAIDLAISDGRTRTALLKSYIDNELVFVFTINELTTKLHQIKS
jgi:hypothetical protein